MIAVWLGTAPPRRVLPLPSGQFAGRFGTGGGHLRTHCTLWFLGKDAYMRRSAWTLGVAAIAATSLGVAACGSSGNSDNGKSTSKPTSASTPPAGAKQGGKLTVLWSGDVDHI